MFRVYICNTKQILVAFGGRRSGQNRTTERYTQREREKERRSSARIRDVFFLGYERSCRHISARIDALISKRGHPPRIVFLAFGFFSQILSPLLRRTHINDTAVIVVNAGRRRRELLRATTDDGQRK